MKKIYSLTFILFTALAGMAQSHPTNTDNAVVLKDSLHVHGNVRVNGYLMTKHIKSPDGILHIGDSSMTYQSFINQTNPIKGISTASMEFQSTSTATSGIGLGWSNSALGSKSIALGYGSQAFGDYSLAFGAAGATESDADFSTTMGWNVKTTSAATKSIAMGSGYVSNPMTNSIANSLAIGFNSNVPTFFVGPAAGTSGSLGKIGIGTTAPAAELHVITPVSGDVLTITNASGTEFFRVANDGSTFIGGHHQLSGGHTGAKLQVYGDVVIGTGTSANIWVTQNNWSDFVFEKNYPLMPLNEVEFFYKTNHHLPGVPTTKDIQAQGNNLGQTDVILLQKIEELTLYVVSLKKEIDALKNNKK